MPACFTFDVLPYRLPGTSGWEIPNSYNADHPRRVLGESVQALSCVCDSYFTHTSEDGPAAQNRLL